LYTLLLLKNSESPRGARSAWQPAETFGDAVPAGAENEAVDAAAALARESTDVTRIVLYKFTLGTFKGRVKREGELLFLPGSSDLFTG
jgi:hypothetical protein